MFISFLPFGFNQFIIVSMPFPLIILHQTSPQIDISVRSKRFVIHASSPTDISQSLATIARVSMLLHYTHIKNIVFVQTCVQ